MKNKFLKAAYQFDTYTENGALSHSTTGSALLDYFSKCGTYRQREAEEVAADISAIWDESPTLALKIIFYNRLITRQQKGFLATEKVQKGQGNRSEFRQAIAYLARYRSNSFYKNLWLVPVCGTWKDLWHEDLIDVLDLGKVFELIQKGLSDDYNRELLAKYLPRIRSKSNTFNERHERLNRFAYALIKYLGWTPVSYRKFKAAGQAHRFQQHLSQGTPDQLQFNTIPGKALFQMVNNKGKDGLTTLERNGLDKRYLNWIMEQPTAKFTGYVYELMKHVSANMTSAQSYTLNKQFNGLIELAQKDQSIQENVWCALDTSGSMTAPVADTTAYDICISLGVYFATLNEGAFKDHVVLFDSRSELKQLYGDFTDKVMQIRSTKTAWGSTNFMSVIEEIVRTRQQQPNIPVEDFPTTLLVVSDMQFDPAGANVQSNYQYAMQKLRAVGLPEIRIVWWWVTGRGTDFPNKLDDTGVILIGGFDGAILSSLLGEEPTEENPTDKGSKRTAYESMLQALDQEILNQIQS